MAFSDEVRDQAFARSEFKIGLVPDIGWVDDEFTNEYTLEGLSRLESEYEEKVRLDYCMTKSVDDYIVKLKEFSGLKYNLIVASSFLLKESVKEAAEEYKDIDFLIINSIVNKPNVASVVFAEHEGSYIVGIIAALKAKEDGKNVIGFIGGMRFPLIRNYEVGFIQGAKAINPGIEILIDYADRFDNPELGKELAKKQLEGGAYIIYSVAGGTGAGILSEIRLRSEYGDKCWFVGSDIQCYEMVLDENKAFILTSMVKKYDIPAYNISKMALTGNFPGGKVFEYSLKENAVGISEDTSNLSEHILMAIDYYTNKIVMGSIKVNSMPNRTY